MLLQNFLKLITQSQLVLLLLGVFVGWLLARIGEEVRRPNLKMSIGDNGFWPNDSTPQVKFIHIKVVNLIRWRKQYSHYLSVQRR